MTPEEFRLLNREPGWKYEYWNGQAHISPGHRVVTTSLDLREPRSCRCPCRIRPAVKNYEAELVAAYLAAFRSTIEYCDWDEEGIADSANKSVIGFLAGERGDPLSASRVALMSRPEAKGSVVGGAALLVEMDDGCPLLDILFVAPEWQRRGIATALVSSAVNQLHGTGYRRLKSRYMLGNEKSRAWHERFGFSPIPDRRSGTGRCERTRAPGLR